jgi:hypothetical protein
MMIFSLQRDPNQQPRKIEKIGLSEINDQNNSMSLSIATGQKDSRNLAINSNNSIGRSFLKKEEIKRNHNEVPLSYHEEDSMNFMLM